MTPIAQLTGEWILDPARTTISLLSKSMAGLARVKGAFGQVTGEGTVTDTGQVGGVLTIAAASIDTKNKKRDKHLRSADFFDTGKYPDITFSVDGIQQAGEKVTITGTLRVRDRDRSLTFDGTAAFRGDGEVWLDAVVPVNRADFGMTWNFLGTVAMNVTITVHTVLTRR
jgi:polyisoprenoid-binding protein YceI